VQHFVCAGYRILNVPMVRTQFAPAGALRLVMPVPRFFDRLLDEGARYRRQSSRQSRDGSEAARN
jgi:hypothetical protein